MSDPLSEIKRLYFGARRATIIRDFDRAIDLLKTLPSEEARERATVYMQGLAEMKKQWIYESPKSGVRSAKSGVRRPKSGVRSAKSGVPRATSERPSTDARVHSAVSDARRQRPSSGQRR
jgi:hypothetical protein